MSLNCPSSAVGQTWGSTESAMLPRENSEPDELTVAMPGACFGVTGAAQILGTTGGGIDMIT